MAKKKYHNVSDLHSSTYNDDPKLMEEPLLSPQRAFVVQFRENMDATPSRFSGRVEHLISGHATRFHSPETLVAFFAQILSALHPKPP